MSSGSCSRAVALVFLAGSSLFCAGPAGTLVGTVTDPSGGVVPAASVTVRDQQTNAVRDAQTNEDGEFVVALLPPGLYQVSVQKLGFARSTYSGVRLNVDQTERVDFTLKVGDVREEVTVNETPPLVQTDTSTLGQVIDSRDVHELPLNERNFLSFALLVPGGQMPSEGSQNSTQGGAISVNGAREQSNSFLLDGVDNNDPYINQYVVLPSVEAIQEFKVQSGDYSAEFGRTAGAQVNVVLKSGGNQFHGSAFEYLRNRQLDAKNFFDLPDCTPSSVPGTCADIPRFDRNQFGGSLGGPLRRDKTFFFGAYEGLRLREATTRQATVPSQAQKAAVIALVPTSYRNASGLAIFNLLPAANVGPDLANSNTYTSSPIIRSALNMPLVKLDEHADQNDIVSAHYALYTEDRFNPFDPVNSFTSLPGYGSNTLLRGQNAGLSWTHVLRSNRVNEFRLGFNRLRAGIFQQHSGQDFNKALGFPTILSRPVDLGYPNVTILGWEGIGEPINYPQDRYSTTVQASENLAWGTGRHQFKFGVDVRKIQLNSYIDFLSRGEWFFLSGMAGNPMIALAQLVAGIPDFAIAVKGDTFSSLRSGGVSGYLQDDIRVVPRLLLNVGLRYEYTSPPVDTHNRFTVPDLSSRSATCAPQPDCQFIRAGTQGVPRATYNRDLNNLGPRIGVAWRPLKTERFVVRSAYGIFYDTGIMNINIFPRTNPPFFQVFFAPNSGTNTIQDILTQPQQPVVQPNTIARNFRDAYMQQWNVDLQYELGPNWMIDLAYVGSKGTHLPSPRDLNQPRPDTGAVTYPQFSSILYVSSRSSSSYHSLQFRSEKRVARGLSLLGAYTFSKSIDDVSAVFAGNVGSGLPQDSQNASAERGLSDFHAHHRLSFSYLYDLPLGNGRRFINRPGLPTRLLGNWQMGGILTAQSGRPFTVNRGASLSLSALTAFGVPDRPDLLGDPFKPGKVPANPDATCKAASRVRVAESWFNPCAFAPAPAGRFGTAGRNILIGPGLVNFDLSVAKSMEVLGEGHRLQIKAEIFNLLNRPNFDLPNHVFDSPTFTQVLSANAYGNKPPRQVQLGFKYTF